MQKPPGLEDCTLTDDFDEAKGKRSVTLTHEGIEIKEFLPERWDDMDAETKRLAMKICVQRCRYRLSAALSVRSRREAAAKIDKKLRRAK